MTVSDWISLGGAIATLAGVLVAGFAIRTSIQQLNQQLTLQQFADYTKRYQEIILEFPEDINEPGFDLTGRPDSNQTMRRMRAYFDLCFEEWYLNQRQLLDSAIWNLWQEGMKEALSKPAFQQAWTIIKRDSSFGENFERFIEEMIPKKDAHSISTRSS